MGCKYVKDFDFSSAGKTVGYCSGGAVKKPYAKGGMHEDVKMDKAVVKAAVHKHEKGMHPGKPLTKLAKGGKAKVVKGGKAPTGGLGMLKTTEKLGVVDNKNPGIKRKSVPVAPSQPMIPAFKRGGAKK